MSERTYEEIETENDKLRQDNAELLTRVKKDAHTPYPSKSIHNQSEFFTGRHHIIALFSDTHFGSKLARYHDLDTAYKILQQEGVKKVYHSGDIVDGVGVFRGQHAELRKHTFEEQKKDVVRNYPSVPGLLTYFITGNHCHSFVKQVGADIGLAVGMERPDMKYLGQTEADVQFAPKGKLRLRHPGGGGAYALSYPIQRYISNLASDGNKPQILSEGHRHTAMYMDYRNIHAFQTPCFQGQSLFMAERGLMPTVGFWLVELDIKDGSINRLKPQLIKFF